jgi:hypothetical protein
MESQLTQLLHLKFYHSARKLTVTINMGYVFLHRGETAFHSQRATLTMPMETANRHFRRHQHLQIDENSSGDKGGLLA